MTNKIRNICIVVGLLVAVPAVATATDFSSYSFDKLKAMRGSVSWEEQEAFRSAMRSSAKKLTPEEREAYQTDSQAFRQSQRETRQNMSPEERIAMRESRRQSFGDGSSYSSGGRGMGGGGGGRGRGRSR
jgi:hypothetical protein